MTTLATHVRGLVGTKTAEVLEEAFAIRTAGDLMAHYPRRYEKRGELTPLADLRDGDEVTVVGEVVSARDIPYGTGKRTGHRLVAQVRGTEGGSRTLELVWFSKRPQHWRQRELASGTRALFAGTVGTFNGKKQLKSPAYQLLDRKGESEGAVDPESFAGQIIPLYPATARLASWQIGLAVRLVLDGLDIDDDPLPADLRGRHRMPSLLHALRMIHRPGHLDQVEDARHRLRYDEAMALQTALARRRSAPDRLPAVARPQTADGLLAAFDARLPFTLTDGQREVGRELAADLAREHPMHRLLSGEVGSGKTVVALRAMLQVVDAGGQAALLAPTEVLAAQHLRSVRDLLGPLGEAGELGAAEQATAVALLTGSQTAAARRAGLALAAGGGAGIVVGTHALLSEQVQFADLGLVVVDEQHRFGVEQRDALRSRGRDGTAPHVLVMTATPIPRTVAMTVFGDLETSALTELPRGRQPITTHLVEPRWVGRMWEVVRDQVASGRQAYVVCPRIETSDGDEGRAAEGVAPAAAVTEVLPALAAGELAGLRLAMLHGGLGTDEKDQTMRAFAAGRLDVLVATTVIEVGVDVPNATVMVILDADRFGVSQLHQMRGRVGRGEHASTCFLQTSLPDAAPAVDRLRAVAGTDDGVLLARVDLEARGEGDVLGAAQSGTHSQLRLLRLLRDEAVIAEARTVATEIVTSDPTLAAHPGLRLAVDAFVRDPSYLEKG
ncbi:MAG: ATP-dependent DNA helicase RecG [Mycobacteriales bacterium]